MFLSSGDRDVRVAFKVHVGSLASSRVEAKNSVLLLSCHPYLLKPIEWPKGSQASCGVLRGDSGLLSGGKERPHLAMTGNLVVFLELRHDISGFSHITTVNSGSLLCGPREVQSPFEL